MGHEAWKMERSVTGRESTNFWVVSKNSIFHELFFAHLVPADHTSKQHWETCGGGETGRKVIHCM